ncbi:MAG: hypothetical protein ACI8XB_003126, partial [Patiriisocius sp.]
TLLSAYVDFRCDFENPQPTYYIQHLIFKLF